MREIKNNMELFNYFDSINDLYNWLRSTPRRNTANNSSNNGGIGFCDTSCLEEAIKKMVFTDNELYIKFLKTKNKLKTDVNITKNRKMITNDVIGFIPNVPNHIIGIPQDMIKQTSYMIKTKIINLVIVASVSASYSSDDLNKFGVTMTNVIDNLEKQGYRCNLYLVYGVVYKNEKSIFCLKLKSDCEPINIKKLVFPLCSSSMFRRIGFYWIEASNMKHDPTKFGYGGPIRTENYIKQKVDTILNINSCVIVFQNNKGINEENILNQLSSIDINL